MILTKRKKSSSIKAVGLVLAVLLIVSAPAFAQLEGVSINGDGTPPDPSSLLDVTSTNRGILIPRLSTVQRNAIASPANSLLVFDVDSNKYMFYHALSASWKELGSSGSVGPAGATGADGAIGASGAAGADGTDGAIGATGSAGADGTDGAIGATGSAGTNGTDGAIGATGSAGTNGTDGATGSAGADGTDGAIGATGSAGADGTDGAIGATGSAGADGTDGAIGATGPIGLTGADGVAGATGSTGATGPTGQDGALNAWSLTGNSGTVPGTNFIGTTDAQDVVLKTNNQEQLRVTTAGNAGVGTSLPTARLHVKNVSGLGQLRLESQYIPTGTNDPNGQVGEITWGKDKNQYYMYIRTPNGWYRQKLNQW